LRHNTPPSFRGLRVSRSRMPAVARAATYIGAWTPSSPAVLFPRDAGRDALTPKVSPETVIGGSCRSPDLDAA